MDKKKKNKQIKKRKLQIRDIVTAVLFILLVGTNLVLFGQINAQYNVDHIQYDMIMYHEKQIRQLKAALPDAE